MKILSGVSVFCLVILIGACVQNELAPRVPALFHVQGESRAFDEHITIPVNTPLPVFVGSDASAPGLAPAITNSLLSILGNRAVQHLHEHLSITGVLLDQSTDLEKLTNPAALYQEVENTGSPYLLVVMFSSKETESATHLGAQPIMTQMPGVAVENHALAELALLDIGSKRILLEVEGRASDTLEELTVPIGDATHSSLEGRNLLRGMSPRWPWTAPWRHSKGSGSGGPREDSFSSIKNNGSWPDKSAQNCIHL